MRDSYMDCPDRERAQWWGDVVNALGEAFYALDTQRSYALARKRHARANQLAAGRTACSMPPSPES